MSERINVATLKRQSTDRATQSRVQDYDSSARGHELILRYSTLSLGSHLINFFFVLH
ncbi:hypothetical protein IH879_18555 [candidate division KSB1 bacterium]|nr:hypothetical protein [candidate division KSB1 bacterium]